MASDVDVSSFDTLDLMELLDYESSVEKAWKVEEYVLNDAFGNYSKASELNDYLINNPINIGTLLVLLSQASSLHGYEMAMKKLAKDPKQAEKIIVRECWEAWQNKPEQYTKKIKFATAMVDKFRPDDPEEESKHLCNPNKIVEWCGIWEREKHTQLAK